MRYLRPRNTRVANRHCTSAAEARAPPKALVKSAPVLDQVVMSAGLAPVSMALPRFELGLLAAAPAVMRSRRRRTDRWEKLHTPLIGVGRSTRRDRYGRSDPSPRDRRDTTRCSLSGT